MVQKPVPVSTFSVLPPLYARWIDQLLRSPIPAETRATCDDCAMCSTEPGAGATGTFFFSPRVKCCSYLPRLPNFLVGRALEDTDFAFSAGRSTLEKRLDAGLGATPLGLDQTEKYRTLYQAGPAAFGQSETLRCPHFLDEAGGRCGIWKHRNSVCATWFCKHERGAIGLEFWHRVRDLLMSIESSLSIWCVLESDLAPAAIARLFPERPRSGDSLTAADLDESAEPSRARRLWGDWFGREREFYLQCGRRVDSLSWPDVARIGGMEVVVRARLAQQAYEALTREELPARLTAGAIQILSTGPAGVRVVGYLATDPLDLDPDVVRILPYFDGRPTAEATAGIRDELGLIVEKDLVRELADYQILLSVEPPIG